MAIKREAIVGFVSQNAMSSDGRETSGYSEKTRGFAKLAMGLILWRILVSPKKRLQVDGKESGTADKASPTKGSVGDSALNCSDRRVEQRGKICVGIGGLKLKIFDLQHGLEQGECCIHISPCEGR